MIPQFKVRCSRNLGKLSWNLVFGGKMGNLGELAAMVYFRQTCNIFPSKVATYFRRIFHSLALFHSCHGPLTFKKTNQPTFSEQYLVMFERTTSIKGNVNKDMEGSQQVLFKNMTHHQTSHPRT